MNGTEPDNIDLRACRSARGIGMVLGVFNSYVEHFTRKDRRIKGYSEKARGFRNRFAL